MLVVLKTHVFYQVIAGILLGFQALEFLYVSITLMYKKNDEPRFSYRMWSRFNLLRLFPVVIFILVISFYPFDANTGTSETDMEQMLVDTLTTVPTCLWTLSRPRYAAGRRARTLSSHLLRRQNGRLTDPFRRFKHSSWISR